MDSLTMNRLALALATIALCVAALFSPSPMLAAVCALNATALFLFFLNHG